MTKTIVLDADKVEKLADHLKNQQEKEFEIISASIKDEQCNYGYELLTGRNVGDVIPNRKGAHFIHDDLREAFENMDVFLAHIDGVFNSWANNQTHISSLEEKEELENYSVSSIKIVGAEENKAVIIGGNKQTVWGSISFNTPKIKFNGNYLYVEELNIRLDNLIREVEMYMEGKRAPEFEQLGMEFEEPSDDDFETAKVD